MTTSENPDHPGRLWPTGLSLARTLNDECIRQGANVPLIFEAAGRIVAAYCLHGARWSVDQERLEPTNEAAGERAAEILGRFTERVRGYIRDAVEQGEDPLDEGLPS